MTPIKPPQTNIQKANKTILYLTITLIVILAAIITVGYYNYFYKTHPTVRSTPIAIHWPERNITINENSHYSSSFGANTNRIQLHIKFDVLDDKVVSAYILDEENYAYWLNNQTTTKHYDSGEISSEEHKVSIPSGGEFYLVFDNLASELPKNVTTSMDYTFEPISDPEPEPFPTTLAVVSIAIIAVIATGFLVYFKKYRRRS